MTIQTEHISQQPLREITITIQFDINDVDISSANARILKQIAGAFDDVNYNFHHLFNYINMGQSRAVAHQHVKITAAMLSASDDPNNVSVPRSVLTTASDTADEFNWMMAGGVRPSLVVLGPGRGSPGHPVIIDRDDRNLEIGKRKAIEDASIEISQNICRPYGMSGLKLQFGEYRPSGGKFGFWPSSIAVGSWIYLEQVLPMTKII